MWHSKLTTITVVSFLILLSFLPLLWYESGSIAAGHDMGYSLNPLLRVIDRLYSWSDAMTLGTDTSMNIGSISSYLPEALLQLLGFSVQTSQKIVFIFWFLMPGLAMYFLLRNLAELLVLPKKSRFPFYLVGSIFYTLNHYLLQAWFVASKQELSLVIVTPIFIAFLLKILINKEKFFFPAIISALLLLFFNAGGANGFPILAGVIISTFWFFIYFIFVSWKQRSRDFNLRGCLKFVIAFFFFFLLFSSYWIVPLVHYARYHFESKLVAIGGISGISGWVDAVSKYASFANLIRLQGFSGWYDIKNHPYSQTFLENPFFIVLSFVWPLLFIASLLVNLNKNRYKNKIIGFFFGLALISLFFMSGTKSPFGFIYKALIQYIPGFSIFRTPFYKFGYPLWLSYAVLISYSFVSLINKIKTKSVKGGLTFACILIIAIYNYPFFTGIFFRWNKPLSTMIHPPSYVFKFARWANSLDEDKGRILLYPPLSKSFSADSYLWNYWSLTPFPNLLTERSVVSNNTFLSPEQINIINQLYTAIENNEKKSTLRLASILNVRYILFRSDIKTDLSWDPNKQINYYKQKIKVPWLTPVRVFDDWVVYKLDTIEDLRPIDIKTSLFSLNNMNNLNRIIEDTEFQSITIDSAENKNFRLSSTENILSISCKTCDLNLASRSFPEIKAKMLPSSRFYKLVLLKESLIYQMADDEYEKTSLLLVQAMKRLDEIDSLLGEYLNTKDQSLLEDISSDISRTEILLDKITEMRLEQQNGEPINFFYNEHIDVFILAVRRKMSMIQHKIYNKIGLQASLEELYGKIDFLEGLTSKKLWRTENTNSLRFLAEVDAPGKYKVLLTSNEQFDYDVIFKEKFLDTARINFIGKEASISAKQAEKSGYSFGLVNLPSGIHKIELNLPIYTNLLFFSPTIDISRYGEAVSLPLTKIYSEQDYLLAFDYKKESLREMHVNIIGYLDNGEKKEVLFKQLTKNLDKHQQLIFKTPEKIEKLVIKFGYRDLSNRNFSMEIENLNLHPLIAPNLAMIKKQSIKSSVNAPQISGFEKINPTFYTVKINNISDPFFLLFKQGYAGGWRAFFLPEDIPFKDCKNLFCEIIKQMFIGIKGIEISKNNHLKAYNSMNAWYIDAHDLKDKKTDATIMAISYYYPQALAYLGFIVSILSLITTLSVLTLKGFQSLREKQ